MGAPESLRSKVWKGEVASDKTFITNLLFIISASSRSYTLNKPLKHLKVLKNIQNTYKKHKSKLDTSSCPKHELDT